MGSLKKGISTGIEKIFLENLRNVHRERGKVGTPKGMKCEER